MSTQERRITSIDIIGLEIDVIGRTLGVFHQLIKDYFGGDGELLASAQEIDRLEHESDRLERRLELMLLEQDSLNRFDTDCLHMASTIDKIADRTEDAAEFLVLTQPEIPGFLMEPLLRMSEGTVTCFELLREAWKLFQNDPALVIEATHRVSDQEEVIDQQLWSATRKVFDSDRSLSQKLQLKNLLDVLESISNRVEDAAHALEILAIRERNRAVTTS